MKLLSVRLPMSCSLLSLVAFVFQQPLCASANVFRAKIGEFSMAKQQGEGGTALRDFRKVPALLFSEPNWGTLVWGVTVL
jgi:hypothetical protein